ncbi:S9 family peptidase [Salinigranum rubrum]|uniref:S9 family peptidase n=1 Tax=Salinigranum rubrum TaxID=755307 RepID=A0A2I8VRD9_9EURY|nr:S9 family peptidase [Salinigranum rubrum]AUV83759.1 S9 family peptidase [Salinigranum rubrum]
MHLSAVDYLDLTRVDSPAVSPDGATVAYVSHRPRDDETTESSVSVVDRAGGDPRRFTAREGVDAGPAFSPSGDRLAFTSTRGDDDRVQLWVVPTDGGEARQVTTVPGGVRNPRWSPDGTRLAFVSESTQEERDRGVDCDATDYERSTPDPRVVDRLVYRRAAAYLDGTRRHVYLVDVGSGDDGVRETLGAVTRLTDGDRDHASPTWGDDGTLYYAVSRRRDGGDPNDAIEFELVAHDVSRADGVGAVDREAGPGHDDSVRHVAWGESWTPALAATDDGRVAYLDTPTDDGPPVHADVVVVACGTGEETVLTADLDRTVLPDRGFSWGPAFESFYAVTPDEGDFVVRRFRAAEDETADSAGSDESPGPVEHAVVVGDGAVDGLAVGSDFVAVTKSASDHPGDVFVVDAADGSEQRLTTVNADFLSDRTLATPEEVWFESEAGPVQGWLVLPPEGVRPGPDGAEQVPLVVEIHGGPHAMWTTSGSMWHEFQTLAARGYAVFWCNPRGSLGYGETFTTAIQRDWGAVTARDVLAGVDTVCARDEIDESHLFLTGGSFGGYMTAWLVGHDDRFRAAVAQRGVYDLTSFYGSSDAFKLVEWDFETTPSEDAAFLWEHSPASVAHEVTTPTLVLHATEDFRVPVNNAELLYLLLKKGGVDTRLVRYPREGHELSRSGEPGHVVDRLERIARWFDGYSDYHDAPRALDRGDEGLTGSLMDDHDGDERE